LFCPHIDFMGQRINPRVECIPFGLGRRQPPRHRSIRAEDDYEAARVDAAVGERDDDPASREEKETDILNTLCLT